MIVNSGKYYLRDAIQGTTWVDHAERYMGAGSSTNTNAGVIGPSGAVGVTASGAWKGPANSDFKLTNEVTTTRPQISFTVGANGLIHCQAIFSDGNFTDGSVSGYNLCEFGIFLQESGVPPNSPVDFPTASNKASGMIARIVNMTKDDITNDYMTYYQPKVAGEETIVKFDIIDFGV